MKPKTYRTGLLALCASLVTSNAWSATITVAPSGADYTTIQAAIAAASPGDTITVAAGVYNEDIVINKSVALLGAGPASTTILGTKGDASTKTVTITVSNVELAGFTVTRDGNNVADWDGANGTLNNEGISPNTSLSGLSIHDNCVTGNRNGILLYGTVNSTVRNNIISNNRTGLHLVNDTSGLTVVENEITGNWTAGVLFREELTPSGATGSVFTNNNISGNWYSQIEDRHSGAPGSKPKNFAGNWFGTASIATTTAGGGEPGYSAQIPVAFGGAAVAPGGKPEIAGVSSANVISTPFLTVGTDTNIETTPGRGTYGFQGNLSQQGPVKILEIANSGYATIQQAVSAATAGQTVLINGNITLASPVTVNKQLTFDGGNKATTKISGSNALSGYFMLFAGASGGSTVQNISFEKTDKAGVQNMIGLQAPNVTFQNCNFTGQYVLGDPDVSRAFEVSTGGTGFSILNCSITGLRQPGYINTVATGLIQNTYVAGTRGWVIDGGLVTFTGNTWGQGAQANATDIALLASTPYSALYDPLATLIANNNGAKISNQRTNGQVANLTQNTGHPTIQAAIDAATAGDSLEVYTGTFNEDVSVTKPLTIHGAGPGLTTISGPIGGSGSTVAIGASNVSVSGFTITRAGNTTADWNNPGLNTAGFAIQGAVTGTRISNNLITGMRTGIDINNSNGHTVRNNIITNNRTGLIFRNQTDSLTVVENEITSNWTAGVLFLDASGGSNVPVQSASVSTFSNNNISGNWYAQIVDRQSGGSLPAPGSNLKNFEGNWFGTSTPVVTTANSAEPGYAAQIPVAFGGSAVAPGGQPDIAGPASANVDYISFLSLGTDTNVETTPGRGTYGFQGNQSSLWDGSTTSTVINDAQTSPNYFIPTGTTVTITDEGSLDAAELEIAPGATLVVKGGVLTIGDGSKISGSFTIFNSFGSWNINGDTTFEIGQSLALVSDIHVAAGKTLTVNGGGELILDGCVINSQTTGSPYNITAASDGLLTLARSVVTDARIDINTASVPANLVSRVYDSSFTTSDIEATAVSKVYHNLLDGATAGVSNTDATAAFASIDGWSNVADALDLQNKFTLNFQPPVDSSRTLDADGNLFVQPADEVVVNMDVAALGSNTIVTAEALLGFNSDLLSLDTPSSAVTPETGWSVIVGQTTGSGSLGLVDSTLGLNLVGPANDGINADTNIAKVNFTASAPGLTVGFFRVQTNRVFEPSGRLLNDTRLTKSSGGVPSDLTAFTANTGELVIDDEAPVVSPGSATGTQVQLPVVTPVNVLSPANRVFRTGVPVILTFTATDNGHGLSGLDETDASNDLTLTASNGITTLGSGNYTVAASESGGVVTYTVTLNVPAASTTGTYAISASVQDRSGNDSVSTGLGSFIIANEALATVELQGFVGTTRDVTFVATGGVTKTWVKTVTFASSIGSVVLEDVPAGTTSVSAKTAWTLRSKVAASFTPQGVGSAVLTGVDKLPGGDITGDNVINTFDYSVLRYNWLTPNAVSDITGNGATELFDYNLQKSNFYTIGDPQ